MMKTSEENASTIFDSTDISQRLAESLFQWRDVSTSVVRIHYGFKNPRSVCSEDAFGLYFYSLRSSDRLLTLLDMEPTR